MNTVIIILLVVLAIAVVLLFAICGFLFNQVIWYKPIKLPAAKGEVEDDFAKDHRKAEEDLPDLETLKPRDDQQHIE